MYISCLGSSKIMLTYFTAFKKHFKYFKIVYLISTITNFILDKLNYQIVSGSISFLSIHEISFIQGAEDS